MAVKPKLIHVASKSRLQSLITSGEISEKSIVFIKDTGEIWTHGTYFGNNLSGNNNISNILLSIQHATTIGTDPTFKSGTNNITTIAPDQIAADVLLERVSDSTAPCGSGYSLTVSHSWKGTFDVEFGGIQHNFTPKANAVVVQVLCAKLPTSYSLKINTYNTGTYGVTSPSTSTWLTSTAGTGAWQWYIVMHQYKSTGDFSKNYTYIGVESSSTPSGSIEWNLASFQTYIPTDTTVYLSKDNYSTWLDSIYAAKNHTHSEYATQDWTSSNFISKTNYTDYLGYIGTTKVQATSATQDLTGIGSLNTSEAITTTTSNNVYAVHRVKNNNHDISINAGNSYAGLYDNSTSLYLFAKDKSGNVLINNRNVGIAMTPSEKLDISGYVRANGFKINGLSNSYIPLGGGGNIAINSLGSSLSNIPEEKIVFPTSAHTNINSFTAELWKWKNCLEGFPVSCVTIENSADGGATWFVPTRNQSDSNKRAILQNSPLPNNRTLACSNSVENDNDVTDDCWCRVTLNIASASYYWNNYKFLIELTTSGSSNCKVKVEATVQSSDEFQVLLADSTVAGWPGWNSVYVPGYFGSITQSGHYGKLRFTFHGSGSTTSTLQQYKGLYIYRILAIGHVYTIQNIYQGFSKFCYFDVNNNILFNRPIIAQNGVTGSLTGNSDTATKWKTARTFSIGGIDKTVDGSNNVSWSTSEIAGSHSHKFSAITSKLYYGQYNWVDVNNTYSNIYINYLCDDYSSVPATLITNYVFQNGNKAYTNIVASGFKLSVSETAAKVLMGNGTADYIQNMAVPQPKSIITSITSAATMKDYWDNTLNTNRVSALYINQYGTTICGKNDTKGTAITFTHSDRYPRILRKNSNTWQSDDWEKIYAGYADNAETANQTQKVTSTILQNAGFLASDYNASAVGATEQWLKAYCNYIQSLYPRSTTVRDITPNGNGSCILTMTAAKNSDGTLPNYCYGIYSTADKIHRFGTFAGVWYYYDVVDSHNVGNVYSNLSIQKSGVQQLYYNPGSSKVLNFSDDRFTLNSSGKVGLDLKALTIQGYSSLSDTTGTTTTYDSSVAKSLTFKGLKTSVSDDAVTVEPFIYNKAQYQVLEFNYAALADNTLKANNGLQMLYSVGLPTWSSQFTLAMNHNTSLGYIGVGYSTPEISFGGGIMTGTNPTWYFKIKGTKEKTYNLDNFGAARDILINGNSIEDNALNITEGDNIVITDEKGDGNIVISAIDTTYTKFSGGSAGLVPQIASYTTAEKQIHFLDGTGTWDYINWEDVQGKPELYSTAIPDNTSGKFYLMVSSNQSTKPYTYTDSKTYIHSANGYLFNRGASVINSDDIKSYMKADGSNIASGFMNSWYNALGTDYNSRTLKDDDLFVTDSGLFKAGTSVLEWIKNSLNTIYLTSHRPISINFTGGSTVSVTGELTISEGNNISFAESIKSEVDGHYVLKIDATDTKDFAGSTNSTSQLYLVGCTSQTGSARSYSSSKLYATNGLLTCAGFNSTENCTIGSGKRLIFNTSSDFATSSNIAGINHNQSTDGGIDFWCTTANPSFSWWPGKNLSTASASGTPGFQLKTLTYPGSSVTQGYIDGNLILTQGVNLNPKTTDTYTLGNSSLLWKTVFATSIGTSEVPVTNIYAKTATYSNNVTALGFYESSDRRLKSDIGSITIADKLSEIEFKQFKFKGDSKIKYGVIAQDLEEIGLDNLIHETDGYKSVDYVSLLVLEITRLRKKIEQLEKSIKQ